MKDVAQWRGTGMVGVTPGGCGQVAICTTAMMSLILMLTLVGLGAWYYKQHREQAQSKVVPATKLVGHSA